MVSLTNLSMRMLTTAATLVVVLSFTIDSFVTLHYVQPVGRRFDLRMTEGKDFTEVGEMNDTVTSSVRNEEETGCSPSTFDPSQSSVSRIMDEKNENESNDDRAGALRKLLESFGEMGKSDSSMAIGSTVVVAESSLPSFGLYEWQSYEIVSVYDQSVDEAGFPIRIPRSDLSEENEPIQSGHVRYVQLYSDRYHSETGAVTVESGVIKLVTVRDEVIDSLVMASPVFGFWTAVALSWAALYNDRYGGNFIDALFRT